MTTPKINLSALKKENNTSLNQDLEIKKEEVIEVKDEIKNEIVETNKPKIKISLKWLKENIIEEKKETIKQDELITSNELITSEDNQEIVLEKKQEQQLDEKIEEKKEKTTFSIIDWDTQVSVFNEEKNEIFWSYKGSFSHTKDEIKGEKITTIEEKQTLSLELQNWEKVEEKIKLWSENIPNLQKEVQDISWETNLERYAKLNSNKKWFKKVLVPVLSLMLVLWFSIWTWLFLNSKNLKTNVVEKKAIETSQPQEVITPQIADTKEGQTEKNDGKIEENIEEIETIPLEIEESKDQIEDTKEENIEENQSLNDLNLDSLLNENESTDFVNENNIDTLDKNVIMKEKLREHLLQKLKNN